MRIKFFSCIGLLLVLLHAQIFAEQEYYGPTLKNDGLYRIATVLNPGVTVAQTMVAIFNANSHAFADHNMNGY